MSLCALTSAVLGAGGYAVASSAGARGRSDAAPAAPADWLDDMLGLPDLDLLRQAGSFERKSRRSPADPRIGRAFARMLRVSLEYGGELGGFGAACATRTLVRTGNSARLREYMPALESLPEVHRQAVELLREYR